MKSLINKPYHAPKRLSLGQEALALAGVLILSTLIAILIMGVPIP